MLPPTCVLRALNSAVQEDKTTISADGNLPIAFPNPSTGSFTSILDSITSSCWIGSGDAWLGVQYIGDRDPDRIAEYVQEREDALEGAVAMLDRAWAVPTPEREPETVTKPSPAPEGENWAPESHWSAEGWKAPEAGLEPATRRLTAGCSTN
jgi:hypothetical protein